MASDTPISQFYESFSQYPQSRGIEYQNDRSIRTIKDRLASLSNNIFDNEDRSRVDFCETGQNDHSESTGRLRSANMLTSVYSEICDSDSAGISKSKEPIAFNDSKFSI